MKHLFAIMSVACLFAVSASGAFAQATTEQAKLGASADPVYAVRVQGANDVIYKCKPELTTTANGTPARECIREDDDTGGAVFDSGTGIGAAAPAIGVVLVAAAIAGGGGSAAATTTGSGG